ncbi:MAG: c-type cytochrome [Chloroflexi bacterium]|nr:c-type cytochrome [Chloroflexota bacterium]MBT4514121.1 c-type cytochrome [Chloroflexota bacterium]MBT6682113.1 c-type cytochrome [Chloroflexota bacterium]
MIFQRASKRWSLPVLGLVAALVFLLAGPQNEASAHANLSRAEPAPNSVLPESPDRIVLWYSEGIEPDLADIRVLDSLGEQVDNGNVTAVGRPVESVFVSLPTLDNGTYTVSWANVSTVDGHRVRGSFLFSVGEPISGEIKLDSQSAITNPQEPYLRWLVLLGGLSVAGGLLLELAVWRPVLNGIAAVAVTRRVGRLYFGGMVVLGLASVGQLLSQAGSTFEVSWVGALGDPVRSTLETDWGQSWLWRSAFFVVLAVALAVRYVRRRGDVDRDSGGHAPRVDYMAYAALGASLLLLIPVTLVSHAGATPELELPAQISDYLHLAGAAMWAGGLFHLALAVLPALRGVDAGERRAFLSEAMPRFSVVAIIGAVALGASGVFSAWAQVTTIPSLAVPYGITLIVKTAVIVPLLVLAVVNHRWIRQRLAGSDEAGRWLTRTVIGEAAIAVIVLLLAGLMTSMEPARQVAAREGRGLPDGFVDDTISENVAIDVAVEPAKTGQNKVQVTLTDRRGVPVTDATDVRVRLSFLEQDLGELPVPLVDAGNGVWVMDGAVIALVGVWQIEAEVTRLSGFDARAAFRFEVLAGAGSNSDAIRPDRDFGRVLLGAEIALIGVALLAVGVPLGGWYERRGMAFMAPGVAAGVVGAGLILWVQYFAPVRTELQTNPFVPNEDSIAAGLTAYASVCSSCHGVTGVGDGPASGALYPSPASLPVHVPLHTQGELFEIIRSGVVGTAMQPVSDELSDDEVWHLINYIRTLQDLEPR